MNFKLRLLLLTSFWFALSALVIGSFVTLQQTHTEQRTQQMLHRDLAAHMRDDSPLMEGTNYNPKALKSIFHTLMLLGPDFEIYFLDQQGRVRSHAAPEGKDIQAQVSLKPIEQFLTQQTLPILGDDPRNPSQKKVFSVAPITEFGSVVGYLYVVIGSEQRSLLDAEFSMLPIAHILSLAMVLIFTFSMLIYWLVNRTLLLPIATMSQGLQAQSRDNFCLQPDFIKQVPELRPISQHFYQMSQRIQRQFLQLQQQESTRRELLMQLSHDLKTPLSSVLGYLETWQLQQTAPNPLIATAHRNAQKLAMQLEQQLTLAQSQKPQPEPQFELIALAHVIEESIESLAVHASRKQVKIYLTMSEATQIQGDKQLLQRLFANLLENAIRHAPAKSRINILSESRKHGVSISVQNDVDPEAPSGDLGLGTKIIQSILALHQSKLSTLESSSHYNQSFELPNTHHAH
ncbi:sensor histidine kinase [Photobacterium sanguinicancri]|uniref:sensor histidine kinase n=1 Tax=Photobacterium sanguinicancri TaxID=875932 RepID=UPI0026E1DA43|nr:HAMP domain-containing sensor histidine kinase [Photobacterium sanguinicancri]MDO6498314.1 HAMP domain-containing sensor histidine kinase [Photobacterium sanguinicancri]